ncbi:MAG: cell envelope integrity EipB family protein [Proteobacteria bacterium]|nr:cell envelope integrity EipB family protein [Pseudomonadota bacterium]
MQGTRTSGTAAALGLVLGLVCGLAGPVAAQPASQPAARPKATEQLAPHRAVYDITLAESHGAAGVSELSGRMVYELTGSACQGYTQNMRFVTRMTNQDGATSTTDMRSTSWEDALAKAFRFNSTQYKDTKLEESTDGDAARADAGGEVKVEISKPAKKAINLRRDTYFPVQHSIALLSAARKGDQFFNADLYDGSEKGEKVYSTTSFIGPSKQPGFNASLPKAKNAEQLDKLKSWPISISYYEVGSDKKDALPSYELAFLYFENGVSRRLFIDYGEFAVRGTLLSVDFLEPAKCK